MDIPLGKNVGNSLEVIEAIDVLNNHGDPALTELCLQLSASLLNLAGKGNEDECYMLCRKSLESGSALKKLAEIVSSQGGNANYIYNPALFKKAEKSQDIFAAQSGYITKIDTEKVGNASVLSGAGRLKKEDGIDYSAGIIMHKQYGDSVQQNEPVATVYGDNEEKISSAALLINAAFTYSKAKPERKEVILDKISKETLSL
ncbi:Pyrimidine-nucleoside phosphorylase [bioreactor metagenome]|uniref:Pyrimidine-nucleoside phosphorylase n=1 Tax=bioreactor metagenome TaxID=1076179 RepID=A0A645HYP4_9ZZZZ